MAGATGEHAPVRALRGVLYLATATFVFACGDVVAKHLLLVYAVPFVLAVRYLVNLLLLTIILAPSQRIGLVRTQRTGLVLVRALCLAGASLAMGHALRAMPVGETIAINYLAPFAVMLLAGPLLGEIVTLAVWVGTIAGFLGLLLIMRPGGGLDPIGVVMALTAAGASVAYHLLSRVLARTETTSALLFHTALIGALVFGALTLAGPPVTLPDATGAALMVLLGAIATLGHFLFTAAYREAPASVLAPINYVHILWAALLGWAAFGHVPQGWTILGMALVAGAGMGVALWLRRGAVRQSGDRPP